jgi:hypothetical protein
MVPDFTKELPVADVQLGPTSYVRVYVFDDIEPTLVELRIVVRHGWPELPLNLTVDQASALGSALMAAAHKVRS